MGACDFETKVSAKTAREGFSRLVDNARHDFGHAGYTGTIAEKHSFQMVTPKDGESPEDCVRRCMEDDDHFCQDKWGDAACVDAGESQKIPGNRIFIFFGWASS
jgi:hypothetical protein